MSQNFIKLYQPRPQGFSFHFLREIPGNKVEFSRVENATEWVKHENNGSEQITR